MSDHFYKDILYPVQDRALSLIAEVPTDFYLTGGTALSRFMLGHRYSDDLDFFGNRLNDFQQQVDAFFKALQTSFSSVVIDNRQDSYVRLKIYDAAELKIELVNDVGFRVGSPAVASPGFKIDTWENILSNKLTALQRRAGKDFVDILFLSLKYSFNWETIVDYARQKDAWISEITISEYLLGFNPDLLAEVKFPDGFDSGKISSNFFKTLARESLHGFDNSLYGKKL